MRNKDCIGFEGCESPICPIDSSFNNGVVWYADEEVCPSRLYRKEKWRINQRRIAKINLKHKVDGYFTLDSLKTISRVSSKIKGVLPDSRKEQNILEENS